MLALVVAAMLTHTQSDPVIGTLDLVIARLDREIAFLKGEARDFERYRAQEEFPEVVEANTRLIRTLWRYHDALLGEMDSLLMEKARLLYEHPQP
jgi:hypothetical protein